jgi:hypothetical protein
VSPVEVAQVLEDQAENAARQLEKAENESANTGSPEFQRLAIDVTLQIGLGRFFAAKLRSGVLYRIHEKTGDRNALEQALQEYRGARGAWAQLAERAKSVYAADVTVGELKWLRGNWSERLAAMDDDIADMAKRLDAAKDSDAERVKPAVLEALGRPRRTVAACHHTPPPRFRSAQALELAFTLDRAAKVASARLYYRHANQGERFQSAEMASSGGRFHIEIPAAYTDTQYPLIYYFELRESPESAWLYPGFAADLSNQPYFVVRKA